MIQRIQSILLFLAAGCMVAFLFLPTWAVINPQYSDPADPDVVSVSIDATPMGVSVKKARMSLDGDRQEQFGFGDNTMLLLQFVATLASAGLLFVTIFLYNNRGLQIKLAYGAIFLIMLVNILVVPVRNWLQEMGGDPTTAGDQYNSVPQVGLGITLLALVLTWVSIKRIQRDEKLVKGMDRIR